MWNVQFSHELQKQYQLSLGLQHLPAFCSPFPSAVGLFLDLRNTFHLRHLPMSTKQPVLPAQFPDALSTIPLYGLAQIEYRDQTGWNMGQEGY